MPLWLNLLVLLFLCCRPVLLEPWAWYDYEGSGDRGLSVMKQPVCDVNISGPFYTDMVLTE